VLDSHGYVLSRDGVGKLAKYVAQSSVSVQFIYALFRWTSKQCLLFYICTFCHSENSGLSYLFTVNVGI